MTTFMTQQPDKYAHTSTLLTKPDDTVNAVALLEDAKKTFELGQVEIAYTLLKKLNRPNAKLSPNYSVTHQLLLGKLLRERGEFEPAKQAFINALTTAKTHDLRDQEANSLNQLASIYALQGNDNHALEYLEKAAEVFELLGDKHMLATVLTNIGDIYRELSEYQDALWALKKGYDILRVADPQSRTAAINLQNLGLTYAALGKFTQAERFYEDALQIARNLNEHITEVVSLINLGEVYLEMNKLEAAEDAFRQACVISEDNGLVIYQIDAIEGLGNVYYEKELFTRAKDAHEQAISLATAIEDKSTLLSGYLNLAKDELATQSFGAAIVSAQEALLIAEQIERPRALYEAHELLAKAYKAQGAFEKTVYHLEAFYAVKERIFNEENAEKTRRLSLRFGVEKANHEAEMYRLKSEVSHKAQEEAERLVQSRTAELQEAQLEIVNRLAVAAEYRDDDTGAHTRRVGRTAALIAYALGWSLRDVQLLHTAARLHDVGKIGISDMILLKPGKLTSEEFDIIKTHTSIGASILKNGHSPLLQLAETIAQSHHERWDGNGYPHKLAGANIPQAARIVSVADVLDALTHERPYKRAWTASEALAEIARNSGTQFDPEVVSVCLDIFGEDSTFAPQDVTPGWQELLEELEQIKPLRRTRVPA